MSRNGIKIGVLGCANIAERFVIPAINESESFDLIAVASRTSTKSEEFSTKFKAKAINGYEELLSIDELDAIYIPLPNSMHYQWIKRCLENKKHVLVEKSMACNSIEVEELNKIALESGLILLENFQFTKHRQLDVMKALVSEGAIGDLRVIRSSFGFPPFQDENNIRYQKELGGGALLDAGAYPIKIAQEFVSGSLNIDSASLHIDPKFGVDTWGSAQLKEENSALTVQIAFGFDHAYQCNIELWGSKGTLKANRIFTSPPGAEAELLLSNCDGLQTIKIESDNHFKNMLDYFAYLITFPEKSLNEYANNNQQAKLIDQLRIKASE